MFGAEAEPIVENLIGDAGSSLGKLCIKLLTGAVDAVEFIQQATKLLQAAGKRAALIVGLSAPDATQLAADLYAAAEADLTDFSTQIASAGALARAARDAKGQAEGSERGDVERNLEQREIKSGLSEAQAVQRAHNWAGYFGWGGFQSALHQRAQDGGFKSADWELDPGADHCDDCQANADGGPYPIDGLPTLPGLGDTRCRGNCRCRIRYTAELP